MDSALGVGRRTVYCTDLYPAFPGYEILRNHHKCIRRPSQAQVRSAIDRGFLRAELDIVKPRAILLLGAETYAQFYRYMLQITASPGLEAIVARIQNVDLPSYKGAVVVPFFHPSPANPKFLRWFKRWGSRLHDSPLIQRLSGYLDS